MADPFRVIEGEEFQFIAELTNQTVGRMLNTLHAGCAAKSGSTDAGPIITGALSSVVEFIMMGGHDEATVRAAFTQVLDTMPQQFALMRAALAAGAGQEGTA